MFLLELQLDRRIRGSDLGHLRAWMGPRGFREKPGRRQLLDGRRKSRDLHPQGTLREHLLRRSRPQGFHHLPADRNFSRQI